MVASAAAVSVLTVVKGTQYARESVRAPATWYNGSPLDDVRPALSGLFAVLLLAAALSIGLPIRWWRLLPGAAVVWSVAAVLFGGLMLFAGGFGGVPGDYSIGKSTQTYHCKGEHVSWIVGPAAVGDGYARVYITNHATESVSVMSVAFRTGQANLTGFPVRDQDGRLNDTAPGETGFYALKLTHAPQADWSGATVRTVRSESGRFYEDELRCSWTLPP